MSITAAIPPKTLTFTLLRLLADGEFHSGEDMARQLGMSRASVHNALHDVAQYGVLLHSVRGRGYRLSHPLCWLDKDRILAEVGDVRAALDLQILECATSSNALLLQAASQGAASGRVVAVEWQSAGRGRLGRTWHAGLGEALTFSLLWRFECGLAALSGLSLAVGVAMMRALRELGVEDAGLKWPNDVMLPSGKLAGILLEAQGDMLGPSAVVIGIGLNLTAPAEANKIGQAAGDLSACGVELSQRNKVLAVLLKHLVPVLREFSAHGFTAMYKEWERAHIHANRPVEMLMPDGKRIEGVALGVTDEGALRVETAEGLREFHSGEVSLRGR
ncbi:MAG: biotin--[acetyl-CoA-carboxylase] ligase [Gammaproteobacteria bacterium]|nr:biotin--[acetyl-CoA-carboxylase] ligase [Sideroxydans sp.]MBU3904209.1 biotin--[acetyl-CoA-carboxylase] ligase [Gammaproteobacteria bacterium]MBU4045888.1 biotin--[acetyl-CoA-carboxylase] ligase [Gammaproteobacteria bacterium]MBU4150266.1 biotin--[acetyl-CoA-carboxylase] ligase [Gammaproteobacteria bacterium]